MPAARRMAAVRGGYYTRAVGLHGLGQSIPIPTSSDVNLTLPNGQPFTGTPSQSYSITQALVNAGLLPQSALIPNFAAGEAPSPDQLCSGAVIAGSSNPAEMQTLCNEYQGGENITLGIANQNAPQIAEGAEQLPGNLVNLVDDSTPSLPSLASIPTWVWLVGGGLTLLLAYATIKNLA